jgi:ABC-2 type transport system ATP-binding protein
MDIKIEGLTQKYDIQKAVDNISFEVKTGEILGFLGPNGAGKTTTMKMITGYLKPSEGNIFINNQSILGSKSDLRKHIGYLPEHNPLYLDMPIIDYLAFCAGLQGVSKANIPHRIEEMIKLCGLKREKHKNIGELSKGYRQRVGLAQAMIHDPEILILDEPTTGLDPNQIVEIRELIKELGQAKTVILSTHILPEVEATCDRILIINQGSIVADGTADTLRQQSQGKEVLVLKVEGAADVETVLNTIQSIDTVEEVKILDMVQHRFEIQSHAGTSSTRNVFQMCVANNWFLTELTPYETKLEDIFRNLTLN